MSGKLSQAEYNEQVKRLELQHLKALHMEQVNNVCAGSKRDITMVHYRAGILLMRPICKKEIFFQLIILSAACS